MKNITKTALLIVAIAFSVGATAHNYGNGRHAMMNSDNPQYQEMLALRNNPEAMQAWMLSMHNNPEAMFQWMEKMHTNFENDANFQRTGCHGTWRGSDNTESQE
ncbi:MAG TPA: hypothetical protein VIS54_03155 [Psychromonas sp.]